MFDFIHYVRRAAHSKNIRVIGYNASGNINFSFEILSGSVNHITKITLPYSSI